MLTEDREREMAALVPILREDEAVWRTTGEWLQDASWWKRLLIRHSPRSARWWLCNHLHILHYKGVPIFLSDNLVMEDATNKEASRQHRAGG